MIFLNGIAMIAMTALAVPIVIHLHRRTEPKVVDWAAMQFLTHSLVNRRHGLALENLLLLLSRCLLVVLFVLAMARPELTSASDLRWILAPVLGSVGLAWATAVKSELWKRLVTAGFSLALIAASVAVALTGNHPLPQRDQPRDVAIVIDASSSMKLEVDGKSNFRRACEEASQLVDHLPGGSTVSLLAAGPVIISHSSAQTNLRRVADKLTELDAIGGGTNLLQAIEQARLALDKTPNAHKQIVVFSDNQLRSWQRLANEAALMVSHEATRTDGRSDNQAAEKGDKADEAHETRIDVFCRTLPLPLDLRDISVTGLELEAGTVSVHRPVSLVVELLNGGSIDVADFDVELLVNDKVVQVQSVDELAHRSQTKVTFKQSFDQPGWNTVSARLRDQEGLHDNDVFHHVVHVAADLPVLIVNGDGAHPIPQRPATFLQLALDPTSLTRASDSDHQRSQPVMVDAIDAAEIQRLNSFSDYQVILLCDVPRLPSEVADRLANFVERGGGLCVLPGERCQRDFYNAWSIASTGRTLLPMELLERTIRDPKQSEQLELDFDSVSHATLDALLETGQHDLAELQVWDHWKFGDRSTDQPPHVAARLTNGDPLLVEHSVGRGRVLVSAISFDRLESNLISRASFPVLAHLWVEHLAADDTDLNHQPHRNLLVKLGESHLPTDQPVTVNAPDGTRRPVATTASREDGQLLVEVGMAAAPGVYQLACETPGDKTMIPFTVLCDEDEFDLTAASNHKLDELGQGLLIDWITDVHQLEKLARGSIEGIELWSYFAVSALVMLVIEVIIMRWIRWRRRATIHPNSTRPIPVALPWKTRASPIDSDDASHDDDKSRDSIDSLPPLAEAAR